MNILTSQIITRKHHNISGLVSDFGKYSTVQQMEDGNWKLIIIFLFNFEENKEQEKIKMRKIETVRKWSLVNPKVLEKEKQIFQDNNKIRSAFSTIRLLIQRLPVHTEIFL